MRYLPVVGSGNCFFYCYLASTGKSFSVEAADKLRQKYGEFLTEKIFVQQDTFYVDAANDYARVWNVPERLQREAYMEGDKLLLWLYALSTDNTQYIDGGIGFQAICDMFNEPVYHLEIDVSAQHNRAFYPVWTRYMPFDYSFDKEHVPPPRSNCPVFIYCKSVDNLLHFDTCVPGGVSDGSAVSTSSIVPQPRTISGNIFVYYLSGQICNANNFYIYI
jgi:hypothetical protein